MEEQKHENGCRCASCEYKRLEEKAKAAKWEHERRERQHLEHPFYKDANVYREEVRKEQIIKGAHKYPEPFNPNSWTAKELLQHAMQENVDQAHYIFGLFEKIEEMQTQIYSLEHKSFDLEKAFKERNVEANAAECELTKYRVRCEDYERKLNEADERFKTLENNYGIYREDL